MTTPILFVLGGYAFWYLYYGFACAMNGATAWAHPIFMPFQCFWQEIWWFLPGGLKRRADFVRDEVICVKEDEDVLHGVIMGSGDQSWHYQAVVRGRLYASCAKDVLPGFKIFIVEHFVIPLLPLFLWFMYYHKDQVHAFLEYHRFAWN